ncbi:MAG: polyribonucleotide nucleotidyltransferase [Planctomycetes bacterium]|nr:polyribonucleotide nucleotidyltransferase [Planctomycetota bacterium]
MSLEVSKVERSIGGKTFSIETGKLAKQASGAVLVRYEDTVVLSTVVSADPRSGIDFFPLTVDYREKTAAAGKFPGGFMKREGRPTTKEILTMRMIDRPCRPSFPKGFRDEVQLQNLVLSADEDNDPDILAMVGASAALSISNIPFNGPLAAVRVGYVDNEFIVNPTYSQLEKSTLDMVLGGHREAVNMIEVTANELSEETIQEAIEFGHKTIIEICDMVTELTDKCGQEKTEFIVPDTSELVGRLEEKIGADYKEARQLQGKQERHQAIGDLFDKFKEELWGDTPPEESDYSAELVAMAIEDFEEKAIRAEILGGRRSGGRAADEIREISGEVSLLPRTHGSALFSRGETQCLVSTTLGTVSDEQSVDGIRNEYRQKFMLHYNFPPFCVGEARRIMGPGRREIGHGALAERSLAPVIPVDGSFPYTIKLVSEILESNGSSSMATVCAGTLAMMDAGVPILRPVAGISIGMVSDENQQILLTDILGEEDHYGDMDFKIAGTQNGITGIQLDLKSRGISSELIRQSFERGKQARMSILKSMLSVIDRPRTTLSDYAPKIAMVKIPEDMIGKIIGPSGRDIKRIQEDTETKIDIEENGNVTISSYSRNGHLRAREIIQAIVEPVRIGKVYFGKVVSAKDFGVFVEIAPGKEGLCHISELSNQFVQSVDDICKVGDNMDFKVIAVDEQGRIKLSHKATMQDKTHPQESPVDA